MKTMRQLYAYLRERKAMELEGLRPFKQKRLPMMDDPETLVADAADAWWRKHESRAPRYRQQQGASGNMRWT